MDLSEWMTNEYLHGKKYGTFVLTDTLDGFHFLFLNWIFFKRSTNSSITSGLVLVEPGASQCIGTDMRIKGTKNRYCAGTITETGTFGAGLGIQPAPAPAPAPMKRCR